MSLEAAVVVGLLGHGIHWHLPRGRTAVSLPDDRTLWSVIWQRRHEIKGIAHSHPGRGLPQPSHTDVTTFRAIEKALGRRLTWWIISEDTVAVCRWTRRSRSEPGTWIAEADPTPHTWLAELRKLSYGGT